MKKTTKSLYKSEVNYTLHETNNKKNPLKRVIAGKKTFLQKLTIIYRILLKIIISDVKYFPIHRPSFFK